MSQYQLMMGDCLELMRDLPDGSVDMILCDLPYGTTACKWDSVIPFEPLWAAYRSVTKPNAAIVLTASQPFTSALVISNASDYRHSWVWDKATISNPLQAKHQPLRQHEDVLVFAKHTPQYFPIKTELDFVKKWTQFGNQQTTFGKVMKGAVGVSKGKYPKTIQRFPSAKLVEKTVHPTQKPVALMEYLIRTYTNEGELVMDNCMGSGTTGVACMNTGRRFIGIERDAKYFEMAEQRITAAAQKPQD